MSESERLLLQLEGSARTPAELPRAGQLVLGSSRERAGFVLEGQGVAAVHCTIARAKGGGWAVRDLGSSAGTRLNGALVEAARLSAGDVLELGSLRLTIVDPNAKRAPAPPGHDTEFAKPLDSRTPAASAEPARTTAPAISGYQVERRLGRGGMGEVWLAQQTSLDRPVALKILERRLSADREFVQRFQSEARAAAALNHPNVVTVYDVGEQAGTHYLSMEYMDRGNLEERVQKNGPLSWNDVLEILRQAASGLVYAQARGILHRDLKPANLMQNHAGATKIADLGLATHVEAEERASVESKIYGTPHFMSPEQARGEKLDSRSDLYSLGATAYRLLTAHTPYEGATSRDILRALLREEPRSMRELVPNVPEAAAGLVSKLMHKDPAQRFASASALLLEIERLRTHSAASTAPLSPSSNRGSRAPLVLGLFVVCAAGAAAWWLWHAKQKQDIELQQAAAARGKPEALVNTAPPPNAGAAAAGQQRSTPDPASGAAPPKVVDDEKVLELFETKARVALLEILNRPSSAEEKRDALRSMAANFRGSTAATEALEKAVSIADELATRAAASESERSAVDILMTRLRTAAKLEDDPPHPGRSLLAMRAVDGQAALALDPLFKVEKDKLESELLTKATSFARAVLEDTQRDLDSGEFERVTTKLTALMAVFDLPEFPLGHAPTGVSELFEVGRTARERLHNIEQVKTSYAAKHTRDDVLGLAQGLGGPTGLERELRTLDFAAARTRLAGLTAKAATGATQDFVRALNADLERGEALFALLAREYAAGNWKRKGFGDPRDKHGTQRNAVGADPSGVSFDGEGGLVEHLAWGAFGANTKELAKLFVERLGREYTSDEAKAVLGLLRIAAALEAIEISAKVFDPTRKANFSEQNVRELGECFAPGQSWAAKYGPSPAFAREAEAGNLLAQTLSKSTEGAWSVAVAGIERLLSEYKDTLLVHLLSDGSSSAGLDALK